MENVDQLDSRYTLIPLACPITPYCPDNTSNDDDDDDDDDFCKVVMLPNVVHHIHKLLIVLLH